MSGTLRLPSKPADSDASAQVARQSPPTVLIADDDKLVVATLGRGLRNAGFSVFEAFDSATALALCTKHRPSLAILDYKMPDMSGIELAKLVNERTGVPVVFLSAYDDAEVVEAAVSAGAMKYLVKPIDTGQLVPVIRSAVERAQDLKLLRTDKMVSIATGLLMSRLHLSQRDAYARLRRQARSSRVRVEEVASELLRISEDDSRLYEALSFSRPSAPHRTDEKEGR